MLLKLTPMPGTLKCVIFASPSVISLLVVAVDASTLSPIIMLLLPVVKASPALRPNATFPLLLEVILRNA